MQGIWDGIAHAEHAATEAEQTTKRIMRILTVAERQHGLSNALTALLGQQPGATWERVGDGLCEIIASAMLALSTIAENPEAVFARYIGAEEKELPRLAAEALNAFTPGVLNAGVRPARTVTVGTLAESLNPAVEHPEALATDGDSR